MVNLPYLIVGLGNPGEKYRNTRHNQGFKVTQLLSDNLSFSFKKPFFRKYRIAKKKASCFILLQPLTFMNCSGVILPRILDKYSIPLERMIVIVDNLDLPEGSLRMKRGGSDAGHNGLKSIIKHLGCSDFLRLYIGIGRPGPQQTVIDYVLGVPCHVKEMETLAKAHFKAVEAIMMLEEKKEEEVIAFVNQKNNSAKT